MARATLAALALLFTACGDSRCALKPNPGLCLANFDAFYFDAVTSQCASFTWGGCDGVVPFKSLSDCEQACE